MANWVASIVHTLRAEFPSFETLQAWGVFNVSQHDRDLGASTVYAANTHRCYQFARLIEAFGVQATPSELVDQLASSRHLAARLAAEEALSSRDAWMRAAETTTTKSRGGVLNAGRSPPSALLQLVIRYWAAGGSTSGVEQSFGKGLQPSCLVSGHGRLQRPHGCAGRGEGDMQQVLASARDVWMNTFGLPRVSGSGNKPPRLDLGG